MSPFGPITFMMNRRIKTNGERSPHFITSTNTGRGVGQSMRWNRRIKQFEGDHVLYDNPAIHRPRR